MAQRHAYAGQIRDKSDSLRTDLIQMESHQEMLSARVESNHFDSGRETAHADLGAWTSTCVLKNAFSARTWRILSPKFMRQQMIWQLGHNNGPYEQLVVGLLDEIFRDAAELQQVVVYVLDNVHAAKWCVVDWS